MIKKEIKVCGRELILEEYSSLTELIRVMDEREPNFGESSDRGWGRDLGYNSPEDIYSEVFCSDVNLEHFQSGLKEVKSKKKTSPKNELAPEGYHPVIPNALMGLPNSMIRSKLVKKDSKIVEVNIDGTYSWGEREEYISRYFGSLLGEMNVLERKGYRVEINLWYAFSEEEEKSKIHMCKIKLKKASSTFSKERLNFPLTNPGMFRGIMFRWYEKLPGAEYLYGYGTPMSRWSRSFYEEREEIKAKAGVSKNSISLGADYSYLLEIGT